MLHPTACLYGYWRCMYETDIPGWRKTFAAPRTTRNRCMSVDLQHNLESAFTQELPHLTAEDGAFFVRIIERLRGVYQPDRIYLFGSKARGDAGPTATMTSVLVAHPVLYRLAQRGLVSRGGVPAAGCGWCGTGPPLMPGCICRRFRQPWCARGGVAACRLTRRRWPSAARGSGGHGLILDWPPSRWPRSAHAQTRPCFIVSRRLRRHAYVPVLGHDVPFVRL